MPQGKVFHSFAELADDARFQASKKRRHVEKLPPPPVQPVLTAHERPAKPKVAGRINARRRA